MYNLLPKKLALVSTLISLSLSWRLKITFPSTSKPKIKTCLNAVNNGVTGVVIVDGRKPHSILFELFSDKGAGTLIRKWKN